MFFFRILNANPDDGVAVVLCLITIWWCVRYVPRGPGPTRFVLAGLGVLSACLGTKMMDAMISVSFLVAAILLEIMETVTIYGTASNFSSRPTIRPATSVLPPKRSSL
jgi:hypothetical protein